MLLYESGKNRFYFLMFTWVRLHLLRDEYNEKHINQYLEKICFYASYVITI
jgi:hypothetical protein